ncbi:sodium:solute symporter family protein [Amycolatopsis alkalitolerans]|uniref:Sodium:solute symporter family protein n=1 Tax=Amycolatopsis alkalitolerans TaxID=2547244 RepID=A0A5C4M5K1_9PSEU|nr:sodium:solute symporter family protein [Amycolatopsis alkalitolerans]TNC25776.1 sodium:solute symporter family protein [Amycolatopsis alkalitolerans]
MALTIALVIALGAVLGGGLLAARGVRMDVAEWSVGGRRLGTALFWFLLVGETFTTFALLGASQGVFSGGAPGFYVLGTVVLFAAAGYWIVPRIWQAGKQGELLTMGDYFARRFSSPWFGRVVALFGIIALLLYMRVQLTGLGLILQNLLGFDVSPKIYLIAGAVVVAVFALAGGLRAAAFVAVVKDVLLVVALLVIAIGAAKAAGVTSVGGVFDGVARKFPDAATVPGIGGSAKTNLWWWMSFLLLTPATFAMPHQFQVSFSAKDAATIRRNSIIQPLYSLFYVAIIYIAYAALLVLPKLSGSAANKSLLMFVHQHFPPAVIGMLAGAGILVALAPTAVLIVAATSLFTRNVLGGGRGRSLAAARAGVVVFTVLGVLLSISGSEQLVTIMTSMYSAIGQLAPAVVLSLVWRRVTAPALVCGVVAGGLVVGVPALGDLALAAFPAGTVVGIPALVINLIVVLAVTPFTKPPADEAVAVGMPRAAAPAPVATAG